MCWTLIIVIWIPFFPHFLRFWHPFLRSARSAPTPDLDTLFLIFFFSRSSGTASNGSDPPPPPLPGVDVATSRQLWGLCGCYMVMALGRLTPSPHNSHVHPIIAMCTLCMPWVGHLQLYFEKIAVLGFIVTLWPQHKSQLCCMFKIVTCYY